MALPVRAEPDRAPDVELVIGKGAGMANVEQALARVGIGSLDDDAKKQLLANAKQESINLHRALTDEEFAALASGVSASVGAS